MPTALTRQESRACKNYDREDVLAAVGEPCADVVDAARAHLAEIVRRGLSPAQTANALCAESGM